MPKTMTLLLLLAVTAAQSAWFRFPSPWSYVCEDGICVMKETTMVNQRQTLNTCKMICGKYGTLWPYPTESVDLGKQVLPFLPKNLHFSRLSAPTDQIRKMLETATDIFNGYLKKMHPDCEVGGHDPYDEESYDIFIEKQRIEVEISVVGKDTSVTLETDESYTLGIQKNSDFINVLIIATNYFGARHGLETLSQLISFDEIHNSLQILTSATIVDKPVFPHRGILIDSSRNFFSVKSVKKMIDAMSYNKLNTFHWHIIDTHSFPLYTKRVPQMTLYGAYSPRKIYNPKDIRDIVEYGRIRGVRIIPEFDAPAHTGYGWQWGPKEGKGDLALCVNKEPWQRYCYQPPCGQLNPVNENMYNILSDIYRDFFDMFESDVFHMGGDEVKFYCWNRTQEIIDWLEKKGMGQDEEDYFMLWNLFQKRALEKLQEANGGNKLPVILWTSELTKRENVEEHLDKDTYIIQAWTNGDNKMIADLLEKGYKIIYSNYDAWYLDCGYGSWVDKGNNWCNPYKSWQHVYDNSPYEYLKNFSMATSQYKKQIIGGETAMWSEQVDENSVESKVWPRSAALAERLWSNPSTDWKEAEMRMVHQRERLVERGVAADALQPLWCHQNDGRCRAKTDEELEEIDEEMKE